MNAESNKDPGQAANPPTPDDGNPTQDQSAPPRIGEHHLDERAGTRIGPYKLLQPLGEGGMGSVWMAEQTEPVLRRVAVKIIKAGMSNDQLLARFVAERQALAMMDHPNIARVLDAGATADGRPYFVMELVKGIPFTKYCDQEHLTPEQRLELFIPVCNAVQHAHQKGIIHRDLKPSNVLIALYDGKPVPKVIDFGIAKAMHTRLTEKTMFTEVGQIIGTLEYMAPEQAELNNLDIDTRADIYSLGVMLYELLTGAPPFTAKQLAGDAYLEMRRLIREVEPSKPSTKLSGSDELPAIAAKRKLEPKKLTGMMQGDLDWIVMKCLEKDRGRRYETANQLAQEIQHFLANEPVEAGPPAASYRLKKFLRRHKSPVIAAALIFAALLTGMASTTVAMVSASQSRDDAVRHREAAEQNLAIAKKAEGDAKQANLTAQGRLAQVEKSNLVMESMFKEFKSPYLLGSGMMGFGGSPTHNVGAIYGPYGMFGMMGFGGFMGMIGGPPGAGMFGMLGMDPFAMGMQGQYGVMPGFRGQAAAMGMAGQGMGMGGMPGLGGNLGMMGGGIGFNDPAGLMQRWSNQLSTFAANIDVKSGDNPETVIRVWNTVGLALPSLGEPRMAIELLEKAKARQADLSPDQPEFLKTLDNLAYAYTMDLQFQKAQDLYQILVDRREVKPGRNHTDTLITISNLGEAMLANAATHLPNNTNEYEKLRAKAFAHFEEILRRRIAKDGPEHADTLQNISDLALAYEYTGQTVHARRHREDRLKTLQALVKRNIKLRPNDPETLNSMKDLARAYESLEQKGQGLQQWLEIKQKLDEKHPIDHPERLASMNNLAMAYHRAGTAKEALLALPLFKSLLDRQRSLYGLDNPNVYNPILDSTTLDLYGNMMPVNPTVLADGTPVNYLGTDTLASIADLGFKYLAAKQPANAIPLLDEAVVEKRKRQRANTRPFLSFVAAVGDQYLLHKEYKQAEAPLREYHDACNKWMPNDWTTFHAKSKLGESLFGQSKYKEAEPWLLQGYEGMKEREGKVPQDWSQGYAPISHVQQELNFYEAMERLVRFYEAQPDKKSEAERWRKEVKARKTAAEEAIAASERSGKKAQEEAAKLDLMKAAVEKHFEEKSSIKAVKAYREFLDAKKRHLGAEESRYAVELAKAAHDLLKRQEYAAAGSVLNECHQWRLANEPHRWQTFHTEAMLGASLLGQEKYAEAEPKLLRGYEEMKRRESTIEPDSLPRLTETLERLVRVYEALGNNKEAERWRKELKTRKEAPKNFGPMMYGPGGGAF